MHISVDENLEPPLDFTDEQIEEIALILRRKLTGEANLTIRRLGRFRVRVVHSKGSLVTSLDDTGTVAFWVHALIHGLTQ